MKKEPLVSVIIIFLNAERFFEEAVESVFAQTYANWELLLVDDGSTDGTIDLARRYATLWPNRVHYLEHERHQNLGMSAARNLGLRRARGEYVAFLDADDLWLPHKLKRQIEILELQPEAAMVYGPAQFWYSWSGEPDDFDRDSISELGIMPDMLVPPPILLIRCLQNKPPVPLPSLIMVRREMMVEVGGFEEQFRDLYQLHEDLAFSVKVFLRAPVYVTSEWLTKYRQHPDSLGSFWARRGQYHPRQPHSAHAFFLKWFEGYLFDHGVTDKTVWQALRNASWPYRYPVLHRLSQQVHMRIQQIKLALSKSLILASRVKRLGLRQSIGSISAKPNPVQTRDLYGLGRTTLAWHSERTSTVEVRIGSPDGPLFSRGGPVGSAPTGTWVSNGMVFYLQDVTGGLPLTLAKTLATVTVNVISDTRHTNQTTVQQVGQGREQTSSFTAREKPVKQDDEELLPVGTVDFGSLRRITPISRDWGFDRGRPVDRYYIEDFLAHCASDIQGRVLEIGDNSYTRHFGAERVSHSDVLQLTEGNPQATLVGDLTCADHIPSDTFDCIILTQTLQYIYDTRAAIKTLYRILKPGGVLLATLPGMSGLRHDEWAGWFWGFTSVSARLLFEEVFPCNKVMIQAHGNVFVAISFLHGLAAEELTQKELDYHDPGYEVSITVRAVKVV